MWSRFINLSFSWRKLKIKHFPNHFSSQRELIDTLTYSDDLSKVINFSFSFSQLINNGFPSFSLLPQLVPEILLQDLLLMKQALQYFDKVLKIDFENCSNCSFVLHDLWRKYLIHCDANLDFSVLQSQKFTWIDFLL